jgi:hypothetical protein
MAASASHHCSSEVQARLEDARFSGNQEVNDKKVRKGVSQRRDEENLVTHFFQYIDHFFTPFTSSLPATGVYVVQYVSLAST